MSERVTRFFRDTTVGDMLGQTAAAARRRRTPA
jgi:hypothetical protein